METTERTWEAGLERYKTASREYKVRLDEIEAMYGGREKVVEYGGLSMVASSCYIDELQERTARLHGMAFALGLTREEVEQFDREFGFFTLCID